MNKSVKAAKPEWYAEVPLDHQGHWSAGDPGSRLAQETGPSEPIRILLKSGDVIDGLYSGERARFDEGKHSVAVRLPKRKTQKWVSVEDIEHVWADKGPTLEEVVTEYILTHGR